jgi:hypothetical protein
MKDMKDLKAARGKAPWRFMPFMFFMVPSRRDFRPDVG